MSALDTIAGIALGGFLVSVAINGNSAALIEQAKKDKDFLKWAIAVGVLTYAYKIPSMAEPVTLVIFIAFLALFLRNGEKIAVEMSSFWNSLGSAGL